VTVTEQYTSAHLDEIPAIPTSGGSWIPIRRHFDVQAFGVNVWRGNAGDEVIGEHDEGTLEHQELYFVIAGGAEFTVGGESTAAPRGTFVFVRDPQLRRKAVAKEPGTMILAVGAKPGEAFTPSQWEASAEVLPYFASGDYEKAKAILAESHRDDPTNAGVAYNLACAEARLGEADAAIEHLRLAVDLQPNFAELAMGDEDLASIRDDPRFPA
jgi:tetratricopeptide (TPR) repeat protein